MFRSKIFAGVLLVLAVLFAQVGTVFASPAAQETTPITGTIQNISLETDETGATTAVLVTVLDGEGMTQTVRISVETAVALGLVTVDPATNVVSVVESKVGQPVEIDPATVLPEEEVDVHPIAAILASFFGMEAGVVQGYHEDGFGFGVIAQALWMAKGLNDDPTTAGLILEAKRTGDYSAFILPDGSIPTNWGQFKKAAMGKEKKNLGLIVSGHAENDEDGQQKNGNGNGQGKDNNPGKGKGKDKDK